MKHAMKLAAALLALCIPFSAASAKIHMVASIPDLGSIAAAVGGDEVDVAAIARPTMDAHRVEVLPSYMVRVSRAKIYLKVGLGLDAWADQIIDGSHNADLKIVDCSQGIEALEKPTGRVDASMGDIHPNGNPHYWLDPHNGGLVAHTVAQALSREDPAHAADYAARADDFAKQCDAVAERGRQAAAKLAIKEIITYHRSWPYLAGAFGLSIIGEVEPLPGIPPTGKHLQDLVTLIQEHKVQILLAEPYFSEEASDFLTRQAGIKVFKIAPSCKDVKPESYLAHFDQIIQAIAGLAG